jgi:hypothetical protein
MAVVRSNRCSKREEAVVVRGNYFVRYRQGYGCGMPVVHTLKHCHRQQQFFCILVRVYGSTLEHTRKVSFTHLKKWYTWWRGDATTRYTWWRGEATTRRGDATTRRGDATTRRVDASTRRGDASTRRGDASTRRVAVTPNLAHTKMVLRL